MSLCRNGLLKQVMGILELFSFHVFILRHPLYNVIDIQI